uniref:Amidase domain-containing protein n=1 Tax=Arion vulgaris TaxID=1028688 RepID=A0A0B6ZXZ3_9EUPU
MGLAYKILYPIVSIMTFVIMMIVDTVFKLVYKDKGKIVPTVTEQLLLIPAVTLSQKIRSRELRAEDVMSAYIMRAKEVNPFVNAVVGEQYDQALRRAQELDSSLDSLTPEQIEENYSESKKPLLGVPLSVKEAFSWTGMANTSGIPSRKHLRSNQDAPVLVNLQEAGAIPFIQTNISEACMWFESSNYVYGCTNNAYDTTRIVGGSSGGEGCILSTGAAVIGVGSDIGGSIRMPCFFNGVFGHKASFGVVENSGQFPLASESAMALLSTGPMCRYAVDLIPCLKVMAGPQGSAKLKLDAVVELSKLRVISVPDDSGAMLVSHVDPELKKAQQKAADYLKSQGAMVSEQYFSKFRASLDMWAGKMNLCDDGPSFASLMSGDDSGQGHVNCFTELMKWTVGQSTHTLPAIALGMFDDVGPRLTRKTDLKSVQILNALRTELLQLLGDDAILLYPSHPKIAPYHNHPIFTPFNFAYTGLFNALGFPVTQCPLGLSREGLPLGVQVVTAPYCDHLSLAVARELEKEFGGWVNPGTCS